MSKRIVRGASSLRTITEVLPRATAVAAAAVPPRRVSASERAREDARAEGFAQGRQEGHEFGRAEGFREAQREFETAHAEALAQFRADLTDFVSRAENAVEAWRGEAEAQIAGLALEVARRALAVELAAGRESLLAITREALTEVNHGTRVRIRVNPIDTALLDSHREDVLASLAGIDNLEVVGDPHIQAGCQIESDGGMVDARVESYLARIAAESRAA